MNAYSVAVYPCADFNDHLPRIIAYIQMAKRYGCHEIFSSGHLPELTFTKQIDCLSKLADIVHQEEMVFTVDFGGNSLFEILEDTSLAQQVQAMHIDYLRLDYGYDPKLMLQLKDTLKIHGFVWNASIMKLMEIKTHIEVFQHMPNTTIRACHNFYPRLETGLDEDFVKQQNQYFHEYHIPVTTCVPSMTSPRGPLNEGLPTIEKHRYQSLEYSLLELIQQQTADDVLIGDEFISEQEFQTLHDILKRKPLLLHVHLYDDICKQEEVPLLGIHHIRYDSNAYLLRSQSSRQMAEFAACIPKHHIEERKAGCITIDNENYLRYSGEIQFILKDLPADHRVNVLGSIDEHDLWKLAYYRCGFDYQLIKC